MISLLFLQLITGCAKSPTEVENLLDVPVESMYSETVFVSDEDFASGYRQFAFTLTAKDRSQRKDGYCLAQVESTEIDNFPHAWLARKQIFELPISRSSLPPVLDNVKYVDGQQYVLEDCFFEKVNEFNEELLKVDTSQNDGEIENVVSEYTSNKNILSQEVVDSILNSFSTQQSGQMWFVAPIPTSVLPHDTSQAIFRDIVGYLQRNLPKTYSVRYGDKVPENRDMVIVETDIQNELPYISISIKAKLPDGSVSSLYEDKFFVGFQPTKNFQKVDTVLVRDLNDNITRVPSYCFEIASGDALADPKCQPMNPRTTNQINIKQTKTNLTKRSIDITSVRGTFRLKISLTNENDYEQTVRIPKGTIFKPATDDKQIAVVPIDIEFTIAPNEEIELRIPVYCNNYSLSAPSNVDYEMTSMKLSDEIMAELESLPMNDRQNRLWEIGLGQEMK